ncbi:response regulator [Dyadobacter luteus]|jgi:CheY-like chemotaxis protein|uniref:Response regulator n=1 Tax=Dyadobacter luteus TaxID=2259619 RepID=A0A3D8Y273_9BACT|nr:response regulator [Dyadobacter luteus]REA55185.1 response regulator [Dyadobacter luteus]
MSNNITCRAIYIADDDSDDRFFVKNAINCEKINATIIEAENGLNLIDLLRTASHQVVLIVVDMNMPRLNGLETILQILQIPAAANVPVVILSTSPSDHLISDALEAGVAAVYKKPDSVQGFGELVRQWQITYAL